MRLRRTAPPIDIDRAGQVAIGAAQAAGSLIWSRTRGQATAADDLDAIAVNAERLIAGRIRSAFPGHAVVVKPAEPADETWTWLVDPLDGGHNLAVGLPAYAVGVALCWNQAPILGVIHDPVTRQTWTATKGAGAHGPGGRALHPAPRYAAPADHPPVLAWTQGRGVEQQARRLRTVLEANAHRLLQLWAPLLSWVMLARGDIDGLVGYRPEIDDLPAGALIAREAGLAVRGLDGTPFDERVGPSHEDRSFVAGHPDRVDRLVKLASTAVPRPESRTL